MPLFQNKIQTKRVKGSQIDQALAFLQEDVNLSKVVTPSVTRTAISTESVNDQQVAMLNSAYQELNTSLESIIATIGMDANHAQKEAASAAGLLAGDPRAFFDMPLIMQKVSSEEHMSVITKDYGGDVLEKRVYAAEAYDDRENRNAAAYSIVYNMQASRQDDFGETFFPTIVSPPDSAGFDVIARVMSVYNEAQRNISGAVTEMNKVNLIRAIADPYVIQNNLTTIVPVYRTQSKDNFVDSAVIPAYNYSLDGQLIQTAPLKFGNSIDLLGIGQTDALLATGVMNQTDSIDQDITLTNIYLKADKDVIKIAVDNIPMSNFTYSVQDNYRKQTLNFDTTAVVLSDGTLNISGGALDTLAAIKTNNYNVRLNINITGSVNIENGTTTLYGNRVSVFQITDASGTQVSLTAGPGLAIKQAIDAASLLGYDLRAYRSNRNLRQLGQLVDVTYYTQRYTVPLRSPIAAQRPINSNEQSDAPFIQTLVTATRIRLSNQAITHLIETANFLSNYVDARSAYGDTQGNNSPDLLGIGRFYVRPTFSREVVDMKYSLDSLTSANRAKDIQAVLVNKIRDHAFRSYRGSEYMAAADALAGGKAPVPTVIVGTDPVLARYLTVEGDLRTLGGEFDVRVVSTLDKRVEGKIFITFGVFSEDRNTAPHPLNFGNLAWSPELVMTVQMTRGGSISKETIVQPRFKFITNLPVLSVLEVKNVPDVLNKVPLEMATVSAPTAPAAVINKNVY